MTSISVVMAVYNGAARLEPTIASILAQTESDFELIIVDDGSTDETAAILRETAASDPRVRILTQQNTGLTRALIAGCDAARGAYIARHDAGDTSSPERLAKQRRALDADATLAFVSCATDFVGPEGELLYTVRGNGFAMEPTSILDPSTQKGVIDGPSSHPSVMFRADAYRRAGGYRAEFYYGQDWDLWYRLAEQGAFQMIDEPLYTAVFEPGTISANARPAQEALAALSLAASRARLRGESDAALLEKASLVRASRHSRCGEARALYFIGELLRPSDRAQARRYFIRALRSCPAHLRSWIRLVQTFF